MLSLIRSGSRTLACLFLLSACASFPPSQTGSASGHRAYHEQISISGRFSVSYQIDGKPQSAQGRFQWQQRDDHIAIDLLSPLGQTLSRILIAPEIALLEQSGQPTRTAASASALTEEILGWAMPADGLRDWLQGYVREPDAARNSPSSHRVPVAGDGGSFDADGWTIRYVSWQQHQGNAYPRRIDLTRRAPASEALALRLVIDGWEPR